MKNSTDTTDEVLVTPRRMEGYLMRLANLRRSFVDVKAFLKAYPEFVPANYPDQGGMARFMQQTEGIELKADARDYSYMALTKMRDKLRIAWDEPDQRKREWYLFELRKDFHEETNPEKEGPPELTPFEQAIFYLQRHADRARHCATPAPDCPAPYFFSKSKRPQRFCSSICAGPAKREAKLKWWNEKGRRKKERSS